MTTRYRVLVDWIPLPHGRSQLVDARRFSTVAKFPDQSEREFLECAWSVVLHFKQPPVVQGSPSRGTIQFLSESAPGSLLFDGATLELKEGLRTIAVVRVLGKVSRARAGRGKRGSKP